jgi:hypothetical protein
MEALTAQAFLIQYQMEHSSLPPNIQAIFQNDSFQVDRVPQHNGDNYQIQTRGAGSPGFEAAIPKFLQPIEEYTILLTNGFRRK